MKLKLLDLFCGGGGASMGYHQAGFDVVGVDIQAQPHYPFKFIQSDALEYLASHANEYDVIHASPPCQGYTELKSVWQNDPTYAARHPRMIPRVRDMLQSLGKPYIIENVKGAARELNAYVVLCGYIFGLKTYRHRYFEISPFILVPSHLKHPEKCPPSGRGRSEKFGMISVTGNGGAPNLGMPYLEYARGAMGIDWMNRHELSEAIPPAYTQYIGSRLLEIISQ
jgi:DNA (cytosine-5)-methyltransferase 1